jgi:hypothetical protein
VKDEIKKNNNYTKKSKTKNKDKKIRIKNEIKK